MSIRAFAGFICSLIIICSLTAQAKRSIVDPMQPGGDETQPEDPIAGLIEEPLQDVSVTFSNNAKVSQGGEVYVTVDFTAASPEKIDIAILKNKGDDQSETKCQVSNFKSLDTSGTRFQATCTLTVDSLAPVGTKSLALVVTTPIRKYTNKDLLGYTVYLDPCNCARDDVHCVSQFDILDCAAPAAAGANEGTSTDKGGTFLSLLGLFDIVQEEEPQVQTISLSSADKSSCNYWDLNCKVNAAQAGDTVFVASGYWYQNQSFIADQDLTIVGEISGATYLKPVPGFALKLFDVSDANLSLVGLNIESFSLAPVSINGPSSNLSIDDCTFEKNGWGLVDGLPSVSQANGGALSVGTVNSVNIYRSQFRQNVVLNYGSAIQVIRAHDIVHIADTIFYGNGTTGHDGAIESQGGEPPPIVSGGAGAVNIERASSILVQRNVFDRNASQTAAAFRLNDGNSSPVQVTLSDNVFNYNNSVTSPQQYDAVEINAVRIDDVTIDGNLFTNDSMSLEMRSSSASYGDGRVTISNNEFRQPDDYLQGLYIFNYAGAERLPLIERNSLIYLRLYSGDYNVRENVFSSEGTLEALGASVTAEHNTFSKLYQVIRMRHLNTGFVTTYGVIRYNLFLGVDPDPNVLGAQIPQFLDIYSKYQTVLDVSHNNFMDLSSYTNAGTAFNLNGTDTGYISGSIFNNIVSSPNSYFRLAQCPAGFPGPAIGNNIVAPEVATWACEHLQFESGPYANIIADPSFTDNTYTELNYSSPAVGAASDGTNIGVWQSDF